MKITVLVKTNSRKEKVEKGTDGVFKVFVNSQPVEGKANRAVIELLADYFSVPKSRLTIISGEKRRKKVVEVN